MFDTITSKNFLQDTPNLITQPFQDRLLIKIVRVEPCTRWPSLTQNWFIQITLFDVSLAKLGCSHMAARKKYFEWRNAAQ